MIENKELLNSLFQELSFSQVSPDRFVCLAQFGIPGTILTHFVSSMAPDEVTL